MADAAAAPAATESKRTPSDFLKAVTGRPVVVKLSNGTIYKGACIGRWIVLVKASLTGRTGILACLDGFMNIAMEQTEEWRDGGLQAKYGDCFIRGNNGVLGGWSAYVVAHMT